MGFGYPLAPLAGACRSRASSALSMSDSATLGPSLTLAVFLSVRLYERRPRGWLTPGLLHVRDSRVAGRGCFAAVDMAHGTIIGAYPGRLRSGFEYAAKLRAVGPHVAEYCWKLGDRAALDPTDDRGVLYEAPGVPLLETAPRSLSAGLLASFSKPTTLALVNEPAEGSDTNIRVEIEGDEVFFITDREVAAGEELYIDYGQDYDRSSYARADGCPPVIAARDT